MTFLGSALPFPGLPQHVVQLARSVRPPSAAERGCRKQGSRWRDPQPHRPWHMSLYRVPSARGILSPVYHQPEPLAERSEANGHPYSICVLKVNHKDTGHKFKKGRWLKWDFLSSQITLVSSCQQISRDHCRLFTILFILSSECVCLCASRLNWS